MSATGRQSPSGLRTRLPTLVSRYVQFFSLPGCQYLSHLRDTVWGIRNPWFFGRRVETGKLRRGSSSSHSRRAVLLSLRGWVELWAFVSQIGDPRVHGQAGRFSTAGVRGTMPRPRTQVLRWWCGFRASITGGGVVKMRIPWALRYRWRSGTGGVFFL